jgi:hypothetical protein
VVDLAEEEEEEEEAVAAKAARAGESGIAEGPLALRRLQY